MKKIKTYGKGCVAMTVMADNGREGEERVLFFFFFKYNSMR
jgi:hypothetical protein